MKKITKLSNDLINKIAAGEVVERPASIIKELIENSLDAKANKIHIEIKEGGLSFIKIIDDGTGVAKDDFDLLFERHATSKIQTLSDLENNYSLGFRGEALASIASVSHIKFLSFPENQDTGYQIDEDGVISPVAMPKGTQVIISDIFYNVPARKKYLKSETTEYKQCLKIVEEYALCHPEVEFTFIYNQKQIFKYPNAEPKLRLQQIYGEEFVDKLLPVYFSGADMQIRGYTSRPESSVTKNPHQFFLINQRPIKANAFSYAVKQAYGSLIFPQEKPQFFLWIELNPADVDMNVHPRKVEARFHFEGIVFRNILRAVKSALSEVDLTKSISTKNFITPQNDISQEEAITPSFSQIKLDTPAAIHTSNFYKSSKTSLPNLNLSPNFQNNKQTLTSYYETRKQNNIQNYLEPEVTKSGLQPLLQVNKAYILCQSESSLVIIDQHAAHERVLYEKLKAAANSQKVISQPLLTPIQIQLTNSQKITLEQAKPTLEKIGFNFSDLGGLSIGINSLPTKFTKNNLDQLILDLLDDIESNTDFQNLSDLEDIVINYAACRGAIKFGQLLTKDEMIALIQEMELIQDKQYSCPHGRPSKIEITFQDLDKQFKR